MKNDRNSDYTSINIDTDTHRNKIQIILPFLVFTIYVHIIIHNVYYVIFINILIVYIYLDILVNDKLYSSYKLQYETVFIYLSIFQIIY